MNNRLLVPILLIGGATLAFFGLGGVSGIAEKAANNIRYRIRNVSISPLITDFSTLALRFSIEITNDNFFSILINRASGTIKYQGNKMADFISTDPIKLEGSSTITSELNVFVDISDRGIPAVIRNIFRTGVFTGFLVVDGTLDIENVGRKEISELVDIV